VCSPQTQVCANVVVGGSTGQKCQAGTPLASCAACGTGAVCAVGRCSTSTCGDGCVDATKGEQCEPPGTANCDATCHSIVCGDGIRQSTEECDDGNVVNLDGCDATCHFEQDHRANSVTMQFSTDALCAKNALGGAIASVAQNNLQTSLTTGVTSGATTIMFRFLGLTDLSGTNQASVQLGALGGAPVTGAGYNGNSDKEWWYTTDANSIDALRNPKSALAGSIVAKLLNASGTMDLALTIAGSLAQLHLSNAKVRANIGNTSVPTLSSNAATPGHLASEHLNPVLASFDAMNNGELCGNISAASLATVPAPAALIAGGGTTACSEGYTAQNHLLDILVGGCHVILGLTAITSTQPDQVDPAAPVAGAGAPYTLVANASHVVTSCKDRNNATVTLQTCLAAAAYSSFFKFTSDRVIAK
jgi:cysteine-rich repeat protein